MKTFNQEKALVGTFTVIVQHRRLIVCGTSADPGAVPRLRTTAPPSLSRGLDTGGCAHSQVYLNTLAGSDAGSAAGQCPMSISTLKEFRQKVSCLKIVHRLKWSSRLLATTTSDILPGRCSRPAGLSADILNI